MSSGGGSSPTSSPSVCSRSWSISEDSLKRYVSYASESCIQELLAASDSGGGDGGIIGSNGSADDGWKVLAYCNGVEISKRRAGAAHVFRSRWLLHAVSPGKFMAVANAVDAAKQWESDLVDARYIREIGDELSIIHLKLGGDASKRTAGLFRRRDVVVYERRQTMDDGTLVVAVASLPKEIAAGLLPPGAAASSGRGLLLQSGWVVEKLDGDPSCCVVTYVVQLDPGAGWLPRCFVSRLNSKLVIMIVAKLKKMALATMHSAAGAAGIAADDDDEVP
uniref:START domain-containing protein n=1 Tax=Oryza punctata TaxID=4537 RepID=A0A0E0MEA2_ORYPU